MSVSMGEELSPGESTPENTATDDHQAPKSLRVLQAPAVGIIILNWNRYELVSSCLASITESSYKNIHIVIVDNGSTDGSPDRLRSDYPTVDVIENGHNLGFAGANNVGIIALMKRGVDYILLLNDDTEIHPYMIDTLAQEMDSDPSIGIIGPKILYYDLKDVIWFGGGSVDYSGNSSHLYADQIDQEQSNKAEVDYITGCALMVRSAVIEQIGLLNESFFIYYEETEFCARARHRGWRIVYAPQARMWHKVRPGDRPSSPVYLYLMARNRLLYLRCTGASPMTLLAAMLAVVRTAASWSLRPRHRAARQHAPILLRAVRDFCLGRFGPPPPAVVTAGRR